MLYRFLSEHVTHSVCFVLYFVTGLCIISSTTYDLLKDEARRSFADRPKLAKTDSGVQSPGGTLLHIVTPKDTLQGIAIRYGAGNLLVVDTQIVPDSAWI